ncbi:50S ribosomal protein L13 [Candidatus Woesearchaeota archaeon]|nr:50S ribosomal protein L13 [Candidatus Woesearchaeota archaeon]
MIIDAQNSILGRVCTIAAKKALSGEDILVVNCEKAVITGRKRDIVSKYRKRLELGQPTKGPFIARRPDMLVRRTIRGMLPWKRARGKAAFKRVKCFIGAPEGINAAEFQRIQKAFISGDSTLAFVTVKELCRLIGK